MLRPSLKDQGSHEILVIYLTCVARFGLDGATQERIAEGANVKRPLLRHYLGNRDEMILALAGNVFAGFADSLDELHQTLPENETPSDLVVFDVRANRHWGDLIREGFWLVATA